MSGNITLNFKISLIGIPILKTVKSSEKIKNKSALFTTSFQFSMERSQLSAMKLPISRSLKIEVTSVS